MDIFLYQAQIKLDFSVHDDYDSKIRDPAGYCQLKKFSNFKFHILF